MRGTALVVVAFAGWVGCGGNTHSSDDELASGGTSGSASTDGSASTGGLPAHPQACVDSTECVVTFAGCCDHCTEASLDNGVAIARDSVAAYRASVCPDAAVCPRCVSIPNSNLHAVCIEGGCTLVDISTTPLVSCSESSDCKLRGTDCCECALPDSWVAIDTAAEADYAELVCAPGTNCPDCTIEVTDIGAVCSEGRCVVRSFL